MDEDTKILTVRITIGILLILCFSFFYLIYSDEQEKNSQSIIVDKRIVTIKLLEIKNGSSQTLVKVQEVQTQEVFDDVFVSKLCPVSNKIEPGKIMEVEKILVLKPKTMEKYYIFDGIYDYLCTNKKLPEKEVKN